MQLRFLIILSIFLPITAMGQSIVVIDPGHGGKSPGAVYGKIYEKTINLNIALAVEQKIRQLNPSIKVILTRKKDVDISLHKRADIANEKKANLFVSTHTNANTSKNARGMETYVMGVDKSGQNLSVAMAENSVIELEDNYKKNYDGYDPKSAESFIIFSLMQYAHLDQSLKFADIVQTQYKSRCLLTTRGVKQAGFLVLWRTTMPSVLTEVGFISNEKDRNYISSTKGQNEIAASIAAAITKFLSQTKTNEITPKPLSNANDKLIEELKQQPKPEQPKPTLIPKPVTQELKAEPDSGISNKPKSITGSTVIFVSPKNGTQPNKNSFVSQNPTTASSPNVAKKIATGEKIFFTVQVMTSNKKMSINPNNFGPWVSVVKEFYTQKMYKYTVGEVDSVKEALNLRNKLKPKYNDCFIVAYRGDTRITIKEATQINQ